MTEPAEYAELVRRLREYPTRGSQDDAADAIEALQARVESMNRALQAYGDGGIEGPSITGFIDTIGELRARISALEAEARQHALDQQAEARASGAEAKLQKGRRIP